MTVLYIKRAISFTLINKVFKGTIFFETKRKLLNWSGFNVGKGTKIVGPLFCTGKLTIGENCWIGKNFTINGNGKVEIGNNCDIAPDVTLFTGGHKIGNSNRRAGEGEKYTISIGDGVWICGRVSVFKDVSIGNGSVIAGCACVVNDVDDNTVVGGIPAKKIRKLLND